MSLIRVIQESNAVRDGLLFNLKDYDYDFQNTKEIIKEKDVVIENNKERIRELENHIIELKAEYASVRQELNEKCLLEEQRHEENKKSQTEFPAIMSNYEKFISNLTENYEIIKVERNLASTHLVNLEFSFADLIQKYERTKAIIRGFQTNQEILLNQIDAYRDALTALKSTYDELQTCATEKLDEANSQLKHLNEKHLSELAAVKMQLLQSKVTINKLGSEIDSDLVFSI